MKIQLTKNQIEAVSKYLADISKLVFGAMVLGFIVPLGAEPPSAMIFWGGMGVTMATAWYSIYLTR